MRKSFRGKFSPREKSVPSHPYAPVRLCVRIAFGKQTRCNVLSEQNLERELDTPGITAVYGFRIIKDGATRRQIVEYVAAVVGVRRIVRAIGKARHELRMVQRVKHLC